ncbi:hypothetical protein G5T42_06740 [Microbacterium sp. 4R-513]|uniref:hypothetical protein n=1 Tax=Microbacterium sp. 4R-513 TaxID=2567934 RepID=UPI0013E1732C|nr:hypothetical protein [Microbacterium sp. 4R-513]QIG39219.1 hypothetical protein G5T42_06740 [Microbacterium sp. 4R-513]
MTSDAVLSDAVFRYVGLDVSPLPGRHPERIQSSEERAEVEGIIARLDAVEPDETADDLFDWAEREVDRLLATGPDLNAQAREALVSLLSFTWR